MSKAVAKVVAVRVLQHLDLPVKDSAIAFADDFKAKSATVAAIDAIIENEKMLRADYIGEGNGDDESKDGGESKGGGDGESKGGEESSNKKRPKVKRDEESLKRQIRMHYAVAKKLETTYDRHVAMAPLCDSRLPCIAKHMEVRTTMHVVHGGVQPTRLASFGSMCSYQRCRPTAIGCWTWSTKNVCSW